MNDCRIVKREIAGGSELSPGSERHLFVCAACRKLARTERILAGLPEFRTEEAPAPPYFVELVMRRLPRAPDHRSIFPGSLRWAAALLLFAFAAGWGISAAEESRSRDAQTSSISPAAADPATDFLQSLAG